MPRDRGHELIEHTADVGLRVWAPSVGELFAEAALGLVDVMGRASGPVDRREEVRLEASDLDALLVDWLSEVLFLFEARGLAPSAVRVVVEERRHCEGEDGGTGACRLQATLEGPDAESFRQHGPAVKAVTYHGLEIKGTDSGLEARVYLDV